MRDACRQQANRRHLLGETQLLLQLHPRRHVLDDDNRSSRGGRLPILRAQRHDGGVHNQRLAGAGATSDERNPGQRGAVGCVPSGGAHGFDEGGIEEIAQRAAGGGRSRDAIELLQRAIPADDPILEVDDQQSVVERFEDVLVECAHPIDFHRLQVQLAIEPCVLERRRDLTGHCCQQSRVLAAERFAGVLPPDGEHRNRAFRRDAGDEVVEARVAPELDFLDREPADGGGIVERDNVTVAQPSPDRRTLRKRWWMSVAKSRRAHRAEVRRDLVLQHQRHAIDQQRLDHSRNEPLRESMEVEVAVQVAREPYERAAIVVPITIERPIEQILNEILDRRRQHHGDEDRQQGEYPVIRGAPLQKHRPTASSRIA